MEQHLKKARDEAGEKECLRVESDFLSMLSAKLEREVANRRAHVRLQERYQGFIRELREKLASSQRYQLCTQDMRLIAKNAETGRGSDFLAEYDKTEIRAGKLALLIKTPAKQTEDQKLSEYLRSVGGHSQAYFAKHPLHELRHRNVVAKVEIQGKKLDSVLKHASYAFHDDGAQGFTVELLFEESKTHCLIFGRSKYEAVIETFTIDKHLLAEMRRTFCTKSTLSLGSTHFNVFELVQLLNEVKCASSEIDSRV